MNLVKTMFIWSWPNLDYNLAKADGDDRCLYAVGFLKITRKTFARLDGINQLYSNKPEIL